MVSFYCLVQTTDSWFPEMNVSSISSVTSFISLVSSFTLPQVAPNLYDFLSIVRHNRRYLEECLSCLKYGDTSITSNLISSSLSQSHD